MSDSCINLKASQFFPDDHETLHVFNERAIKYRLYNWVESHEVAKEPFVKFKLINGGFYGVEFKNVNSVIGSTRISKPPCSSEIFCGVINRKGSLIPVVDISRLFRISDETSSLSNQIIILESNEMKIAIAVNFIIGEDSFPGEKLLMADSIGDSGNNKYFKGIYNGTIPIIDVVKLIHYVHEFKMEGGL